MLQRETLLKSVTIINKMCQKWQPKFKMTSKFANICSKNFNTHIKQVFIFQNTFYIFWLFLEKFLRSISNTTGQYKLKTLPTFNFCCRFSLCWHCYYGCHCWHCCHSCTLQHTATVITPAPTTVTSVLAVADTTAHFHILSLLPIHPL